MIDAMTQWMQSLPTWAIGAMFSLMAFGLVAIGVWLGRRDARTTWGGGLFPVRYRKCDGCKCGDKPIVYVMCAECFVDVMDAIGQTVVRTEETRGGTVVAIAKPKETE